MVPDEEWEAFRSLFSRERDFKATLVRQRGNGYEECDWTSGMAEALKRCSHGVLLIEDVDIRCILLLDAQFNLDPQFLLSYIDSRSEFESYNIKPHGDEVHKPKVGNVGDWYRIDGHMCCYSSQTDATRPLAWQKTPKSSKSGMCSNENRPWCQEACRLDHYMVRSVIACYCLSNNLRKSWPVTKL